MSYLFWRAGKCVFSLGSKHQLRAQATTCAFESNITETFHTCLIVAAQFIVSLESVLYHFGFHISRQPEKKNRARSLALTR